MYNTANGVWLQRDPAEADQNLYAYVGQCYGMSEGGKNDVFTDNRCVIRAAGSCSWCFGPAYGSDCGAPPFFVAANNMSGADGTRFGVVRYGNVFGSRGSNCGMVSSFFCSSGYSTTLARNAASTLCSGSFQYLPVISLKSGLCGL